MQNPFAKLFAKTDLKKSADLAEQLERHLGTWPAVEARCKPLYAKARELTIQLDAAMKCDDPEVPAIYREQQAVLSQIKTEKWVYNDQARRIQGQLEQLTGPVIKQFVEQCNVWVKQIDAQKKANVLERFYDGVSDKPRERLAHNAGVRREATNYVRAMQSEVQSMQHRPLEEIHAKIAEVTANVAKFDFDKLEADEMSPSFVPDFMAESTVTTGNYDRAVLGPSRTHGWQVNRIGE
jgi:exonuclease VII large subunit